MWRYIGILTLVGSGLRLNKIHKEGKSMIKFAIGHYTDFKLPSNSTIPEQLQQTLQTVWDRKYDDLYERGGKCNVEEAFVEVMTAFGMPNDPISHQRYVYSESK